MKFEGTIIITDPCYLGSGNKFLESTDHWWDETDFGENLHEIGITSYISENTLYGDWSCFTYKGTKEEILDKIKEWDRCYFEFFKNYNNSSDDKKSILWKEHKKYKDSFIKENTYGEFCADSGKVCVVYLDEVLKFNPNFKEWAETHPWCVTIIEDFNGNINLEIEEDSLHVVGIGNKNFYTSQSGL